MHGLFPIQHLLHVDVFLQGDAVDILHDNVLDHIAEADVVYTNDVRVIQYGDRLALILKATDKILVIEEFVF